MSALDFYNNVLQGASMRNWPTKEDYARVEREMRQFMKDNPREATWPMSKAEFDWQLNWLNGLADLERRRGGE